MSFSFPPQRWLLLDLESSPSCPECGDASVVHRYVGVRDARTGYLHAWCPACRRGVHISRVRIPQDANPLSFEEAAVPGALAVFELVRR